MENPVDAVVDFSKEPMEFYENEAVWLLIDKFKEHPLGTFGGGGKEMHALCWPTREEAIAFQKGLPNGDAFELISVAPAIVVAQCGVNGYGICYCCRGGETSEWFKPPTVISSVKPNTSASN